MVLLGVVPTPLTRRVSSQWPRFHRLRDGQKLPKIVQGESVLKKCENQDDWLDYWSARKNYRLNYWSGHGRTNRTVCYGPGLEPGGSDSLGLNDSLCVVVWRWLDQGVSIIYHFSPFIFSWRTIGK